MLPKARSAKGANGRSAATPEGSPQDPDDASVDRGAARRPIQDQNMSPADQCLAGLALGH